VKFSVEIAIAGNDQAQTTFALKESPGGINRHNGVARANVAQGQDDLGATEAFAADGEAGEQEQDIEPKRQRAEDLVEDLEQSLHGCHGPREELASSHRCTS